jgi:hypothetical protein
MSDDEKDDKQEIEEEEEKEEKGKKPTGFPIPKDKPRFEVKKWQAVALWSYGLLYSMFLLIHARYCC